MSSGDRDGPGIDDGVPHRRTLETVLDDRDTKTGTGRHWNRAVSRDLYRRIDQVGVEVALARGDVAGK